MQKKIMALVPVLMLFLLLPNRTASAGIQHFSWINPTVGDDPYYDEYVVAYKTGTPWNTSISVYNNYLTPPPPPRIYMAINVTAIKVYFDWGKWYNFTFSPPVRMGPLEVRVFNIGNLTPPLAEAPETWVHSYTIYVEYVPEGGDTPVMDWYWYDDNFAVMSEDHFDAFKLYNKLIWIGEVGVPFQGVNVTEAQVLMVKASIEFTLGEQSYRSGAFTDAETHFGNADNYMTASIAAWNDQGTAFENAMLEYYRALANATKKQADADYLQANAALNNSYGWIFFGVGWTLIGLGIIIYSAKKPKAPTQS